MWKPLKVNANNSLQENNSKKEVSRNTPKFFKMVYKQTRNYESNNNFCYEDWVPFTFSSDSWLTEPAPFDATQEYMPASDRDN